MKKVVSSKVKKKKITSKIKDIDNSTEKEKEEAYKKYKKYLRSKEWKEVSEYLFTNVYKKKCYCCGREDGIDGCTIALHHNSYEHLYDEKNHPDTLIPLCNGCHITIHRRKTNWKRFKIML